MNTGQALAILYTAGVAVLFFLRAEALESALPYYTGRERFAVIATPIVVSGHMALACYLLSLRAAVSTAVVVASVAIFFGGFLFWVWARHTIGPVRAPRLPDEAPLRLRRDGPFGVVRNPLYLGLLVMMAAPLVVVPRPLLVGTWLLSAGALAGRAAQDERRLHAQLGTAYAEYCREVARLIPFVW